MKYAFLGLAITLLTGCASTGDTSADDPFAVAAMSWETASVEDMIRTWGEPRVLKQDSDDGGAGYATWAFFADPILSKDAPKNKSGSGRRTRCEATANFNANGIIESVEIVSKNCPEMPNDLVRP